MNILIVSTHTFTASGKEHVNALIDSTGTAVFYNYNPEKNLRWVQTMFKPLPAEAQLDEAINCTAPGELLFLTNFQADHPSPSTLFGLTLDTAPSDIFKAVLEQFAFYFYFLATENFDISSCTAVITAGSIFRYDSLCRILANLFNLTVERLSKEGGSVIEDAAAAHPNGPIPLKSIQLNSSTKRTDKIFRPVKSSHTLFRDAYYRYLKVGDDVSECMRALKA